MKRLADVIVPLPLEGEFVYEIPPELCDTLQVGMRVVVPFGPRKYHTAIVTRLHDDLPQGITPKPIYSILDKEPIVTPLQLDFWQWMARYYLCTQGEVLKAALPAGMKLESETHVALFDKAVFDTSLTPSEQKVIDALSLTPQLTVNRLGKLTGIAHVIPVIKNLLEKGIIGLSENIRSTYTPRYQTYIRLAGPYQTEESLTALFDELKRASAQQHLIETYLTLSHWTETGRFTVPVSKGELLSKAHASPGSLQELVRKQIIEPYQVETTRLEAFARTDRTQSELTDLQHEAYDRIKQTFISHRVCLLHGVTASGKTEIYIHLIRDVLAQGKQVLYLLPEIALTTQITQRLSGIFGEQLGIYHSRLTDAERVEIWRKQLSDCPYGLMLGVRSSIFLPYRNLGLIIIDEEHESSFKQQEPAPRYQACDAAIMLASMSHAHVLLGTATPSIESFHHAQSGKYGYVKLEARYQNKTLPHIEVVDTALLRKRKQMKGALSPHLVQQIKHTLALHEQIILFQNRRGYAPIMECASCGWVPKCDFCDVSLTLHKHLHTLSCHYCGNTQPIPTTCPNCGETDFITKGIGTEKIEDEVSVLFPEARICRMDLDTTRSKQSFDRILTAFSAHRFDILIGTQMVTKGLDFDKVSLVGIINADNALQFPDFRSNERSFQQMAQVAGRAGRKDTPGLVILQTKTPEANIIRQIVNNDYMQMYASEVAERQAFRYPPFCRLIHIYLKHKQADIVRHAAEAMAARLKAALPCPILGPEDPLVARIQTYYIKKIMIKLEGQIALTKVKDYLWTVRKQLLDQTPYRSVIVYFDVDPQ